MNSVIISDYSMMLAKTSERLVIRGPRLRFGALATNPERRINEAMKFEEYITVSPEVRSGKACIQGTRITVADVLEYLAGGMTEAQILTDFPALKPEHIRACLAFAAARERRLASGSG